MNPDVIRQGKIALNVLWVVLALAFFIPGGGLLALMRTVFVVLLVAHVIEFAVFHRKLLGAGGSLGHHMVQTLLYGMLHIKQTEAGAGSTAGS